MIARMARLGMNWRIPFSTRVWECREFRSRSQRLVGSLVVEPVEPEHLKHAQPERSAVEWNP